MSKLSGKTLAHITLGCKVNMYDTQAMIEILEKSGVRVVDFESGVPADIFIINTCTVTNSGDKKSRQAIRKAVKANPNAVIVVCGCYSQVDSETVLAIEGVDLILGTKDRMRIAEFIEQHLEGKKQKNFVSRLDDQAEFEDLSITQPGDKVRAYIKIQEGCENFCAYCIIPYARGPIRSRVKESILAEAVKLTGAGVKEIVLAGINAGNYGKDKPGSGLSLSALIRDLHEIEGVRRIRLGSVEPDAVDEEFLQTFSDCEKLCDHLHLSLQSGSDRTLSAMNRRYNSAEYAEKIAKLRQIRPNIGITTDIIVGFPGESDKDFADSYNFVENAEFSRVHVFPYSPKTGTKAAAMKEQVPAGIKAQRAKQMSELADRLCKKFTEKFENTILSVLFEQEIGKNVYEGHSDNYIVVRKQGKPGLVNQIMTVKGKAQKGGTIMVI